ncbi:MAG: phosphatidate cytidylyltransferase [Pseudomonadales bacterium]
MIELGGSLTVLKQRVITAVIMVVPISVGIIGLSALWLAGLFAALVLMAAWEWAALAGLISFCSKTIFILGSALLMVVAAWYSQLFDNAVIWDRVQDIIGLGCLWWAIALLWVRSFPASVVIWQSTFMRVLMGLLTLIPTWLALVYLRLHEHGIELIFILFALVAAADIGAYFTGRAWGKTPLAPAVSPGKSWVGFGGGLASSSMLACILWLLFRTSEHSLLPVLVIAVVTALAAVLGDLLESMVKRQQGVKDSGRILPGHGGMLDRIDSITAAAPVFALCIMLAGW